VRREVIEKSTRKRALDFLAFLLQIEVCNRPDWAAQRRARRSYAKRRELHPAMVGPNKGSGGAEHFATRKAGLDAVQGQTDYQARIRGRPGAFFGTATRTGETPVASQEIEYLIVKAARLTWPKALTELAGKLHDYCEDKHFPLPFKLGKPQNDRTFVNTREGQLETGKIENMLKRRIRDADRRGAQSGEASVMRTAVWMWYRRFLSRDDRETISEAYFCYPPCEGKRANSNTPTDDQDYLPARSCGWCGKALHNPQESCRMPENFTPQDAGLIYALCETNRTLERA
jgi:hypothetical protein